MQAIGKIILGTAQFGLLYGINNSAGKPKRETVFDILKTAFDSGITTLDTAEAYGEAHSIIGEFHDINPDKIFKIITKLPHDIHADMDDRVEAYLAQLNVKELESILFHSYQSYEQNIDSIDVLHQLKSRQKLKHIGVSVYTNQQATQVIADDRIDIIQLPFNLLDNIKHRGEVLKLAKLAGKTVHTRSAFLQGLFFMEEKQNSIATALSYHLTSIKALSAQNGLDVQRMALNYCLQQPLIDSVLIGVDSLGQLEQNLACADNLISKEVIVKIDEINVSDSNLLNPSLWNL